MKERQKKILKTLALVLFAALALLSIAADTQNVTVTLTPAYITFTNTPSTWTVNGIVNSGKSAVATTYYANTSTGGRTDTTLPQDPVVAADCRFTADFTGSNVNVDLTVNYGDFSGGFTMANSNTGSATATDFGSYSYYSGLAWSSKVIAKSSGSSKLKTNHDYSTTFVWGATTSTRTNPWTGSTGVTATMTIAAVAN